MAWIKVIIAVLCVLEAGWMAFDGTRAIIVGDYVTPSSGTHQGQLGPWAGVVRAVGIEPRSTFMKTVFVVIGTAWLACLLAFLRHAGWAPTAMLSFAALTLWYAPVGTACSLLQIALLIVWMRWKT